MPNRDHEDSQYNRYEGRFESRDDHYERDQGQHSAPDWDRGRDDWRGTRGRPTQLDAQNGQYRGPSDFNRGPSDFNRGPSDFNRDQGDYERPRFSGSEPGRYRGEQDHGFGVRSQLGGGYRDGSRWFDERREAQHFDVQRAPQRSQGDVSSGWTSAGQDFGRGAAHRDPSYGRMQGGYTRGLDPTQRYVGPSQHGQDWGQRGEGRSDESFGQQLRHAGQQVASRVKRAFRGPKGYKRSDERVREDVNDRLAQQDDFDPSDIEVSVQGGEVTLTGTVLSRHEKFLAEEMADDVSGVTEVHNQLRVRREEGALGVSASSATPTTPGQDTPLRNRNARA